MESTFDFIIVGGGTAGSVIASRLSNALPHLSVLVIEAGPASNPCIEHPLSHSAGAGIEWNLETIPQAAAGGKSISAMCGKVSGGSSAINYQAWTRGPAVDFNQWASIVGDRKWSWDGLLPCFKKTETFHVGELPVDTEFHGNDGPINISYPTSKGIERNYPLRNFMASAYESVDIHRIPDLNSGHVLGYGELSSSTYLGKRQWSSDRYSLGTNVAVWNMAMVESITFENKRAAGAKVILRTGEHVLVHANKEIILCSGAYGSAKLLLLSGIGPSKELTRHNIPMILDLPVGENLSDHPCVQTFWSFKDRNLCLGDTEMVTASCDWKAGSPCDWFAFHRNKEEVLELARETMDPHAAEMYTAAGKSHFESFAMYGHFSLGKSGIVPPPNCSTMAMFNIVVSPTSRGSVTLSSSDPADDLVIDPNLLSTELDQKTMFACLKLTNQALASSGGQSYGIEEFGIDEGIPNDMSTEAINQRIQKTLFTPFHPCGTCAMGTVVDAECKVFEATGLRVVDASIFPFPLAAHYQAAVYAVAEQAADIVIASLTHPCTEFA